MTVAHALAELDRAMLNRGAQVAVSELFADLPARVDYATRRDAFSGLIRIEDDAWRAVLSGTGLYHSRTRQSFSSIWLWSELTGGYPPDAPGWRGTPPSARETYRRFVRRELVLVRPALLALGQDLLHLVGERPSGAVELRLRDGAAA